MAFVPGCDHDIFVSYAHVDDLPFPGSDKGWVTSFVETLRILLAQKLGRSDAYSLWMDHQLSRHKNLTPEILHNLQRSATLLVILSPGYLASEWCLREKDSFLDSLGQSPLAGGSRIFVIERDKVEREERPSQFSDLLGYRFWVQEGEGQPPLILGVPRPDATNPRQLRYFDELSRCSNNLAEELKSLRQAAGTGEGAPRPAAEERPTVFLAEATDDLDDDDGALRRGLDQAGLRVLPETWYPRDPDEFRRAVNEDLDRSHLFVQLLSALPGKRPAGMPEGYVRAQHELALAAGKPVLQWRSRKLDPAAVEDADHRALLEAETVMAVSLEEFRRAVVERALAPPPKPEPKAAAAESLVFVDADAGDFELAAAAGDALESHGLAYSLPLPVGTPAEVREDLEQNLQYADALVVVWGGAGGRWVRNQFLMLRKVAWKRQRPFKAVALLQAPPRDKEPLGLGLPNLLTLNCQGGLDDQALAPLFAALGSGS